MLAGLRYWLSPARRRFMRELARPGLEDIRTRLNNAGSPRAIGFITTLNGANADFLAYALSSNGPLAAYGGSATPESVAACIRSMLIYAVNLFVRNELAKNDSELIGLLAHVINAEPKRVMLMRDELRKAPRSEEWMLLAWLVKDLGQKPPAYDAALERSFGYNYLSYIDQYRHKIERELSSAPD
ncbi:MAG TPA: hypothetical protein VMU16_14140 [Candidatus Binataceae bacterium]|nr:hypothetical protein [Candidatus Binataceae bacterium]